jgi:hypothetical protein
MGEGLVVGLDGLRVVQLVDHDPVRFLDPARRDVAEPIDAFEPGAVATVETRDRIDGTLRAFRADQVSRAQAQQRAA